MINLLFNCYYKLESKTLIFMFNPCHVVNLFLIITAFTSHCKVAELAAIGVYSFAFGGWIGIVFSENDDLS